VADPIVSGIYAIRNTVSGKMYVGSAKNVSARWAEHRRSLNGDRHHSVTLQRAWAKHGSETFIFEIIENVSDATQLLIREQHWIDHHQTANKTLGYNICPKAGSALGVKQSEETKAKLRATWTPEKRAARNNEHWRRITEATRARGFSEATRKKMSDARKGKPRNWAPETEAAFKIKISKVWTGRKHTKEAIQRMRAAKVGKKPTQSARENMRLAALRNMTPERREMLAAGRKLSRGKPHTEETKRRIRTARLGTKMRERTPDEKEALRIKLSALRKGAGVGRKASDETQAKMSASRQGRRSSDETKAKFRAAMMRRTPEQRAVWQGRKHSEETKQKCREAKLGKRMSDATKAKISIARRVLSASKNKTNSVSGQLSLGL
jgi:group I intron endonuclease